MSYDAHLEALLETREGELAQARATIVKSRTRDMKRLEELKFLRQELDEAKKKLGNLNSMVERLEGAKEALVKANTIKATTIADQAAQLRNAEASLKEANTIKAELRDQIAELEAERRDSAPNLALTALRLKLGQAEERVKILDRNLVQRTAQLKRCEENYETFTQFHEAEVRRLKGVHATYEVGSAEEKHALTRERDALKLQEASLEGLLRDLEESNANLRKRQERARNLLGRAVVVLNPMHTFPNDTETDELGFPVGRITQNDPVTAFRTGPTTMSKVGTRPYCTASIPAVHGGHHPCKHHQHDNDIGHLCLCGEYWD